MRVWICLALATVVACGKSPGSNPPNAPSPGGPTLSGNWAGTMTKQSPTATGTLRLTLTDTGMVGSGNISGTWSATFPDGTANNGTVSGSTTMRPDGPLFLRVTLASALRQQCAYNASGTLAGSTITGVYLALQLNCTSANLGVDGGDFRVTR